MNKKLKVLFLSSWYPNRIRPVAGDFVQRHAEAVGKLCDVVFLHIMYDPDLKKNTYEWNENRNKYYNEILIYFGLKFPGLKINRFIKYLFLYFKAFKSISKQCGKPDIVHCNIIYPISLFAIALKKIYKIPFIVSEHWTIYRKERSDIPLIIRLITKKVIKNASCIVPVTINLKNSLQNIKPGGNYRIVPNVINTLLFFPDFNIKFKKVPIIHISSLVDEHKNVSGILKVIKNIYINRQDFTLNVFGRKNELLINYANELNINNKCVYFQGREKHENIGDKLRNSAFLVMFSNHENLPCVILEAFACGIPVISTNVGGISEVMNDKLGILINRNNENELEKAIIYMLDNYLKFNKKYISEYANEKFSYESVGKQFLNIYSDILNNKI